MQGRSEVRDADRAVIHEGALAMAEARTLEDTALALVRTAMTLVDCDHAGFSEVDLHFDRTRLYSSAPDVSDWVARRAEVWRHHMPEHPVLRFRQAHPDVAVVRLSDVTDLSAFYGSGLYTDLFREVETRHQLVVHLGFDPRDGPGPGVFPLTLGMPLNRAGSDFIDRNKAVLAHMRDVLRPILRTKRAEHQLRLMDRAELTAELRRSLMGLGLTERQAEIAFWMLKGKSNTDIGTILDIGAQTVRQHSIAIFRRLGVPGRLALQRAVIRSILGMD